MVSDKSTKGVRVWKSAAAKRLQQLAGSSPTLEHAVRVIGERLLSGVSCPPTDLDAIAQKLNVVRVIEEVGLPVSGQLRKVANGFEIVCSQGMGSSRKRFTVAHELSHALFESTGPKCPRRGKELERICDMLAAEILMPQDKALRYTESPIKLDNVFALARAFQVSLAAAAIRCAELRDVSIFEVAQDRVCWGYGVIRRGVTRALGSALRGEIEAGLRGERVEATVALHGNSSRVWRLEGIPLGSGPRAIFLLQDPRKG